VPADWISMARRIIAGESPSELGLFERVIEELSAQVCEGVTSCLR